MLTKAPTDNHTAAPATDKAATPPPRRSTSWARWVEVGGAGALLVLGGWVAVVAARMEDVVRLAAAAVLLVAGLGLVATFAIRHLRPRWLSVVTIVVTVAAIVGALVPSTRAVLRCEFPSAGADLTQCDLAAKDLGGWDLRAADLSGASLTDSYFGGAVLVDAQLVSADLSGADLSNADLSRAALGGADLSSANLSGATLTGADLSDADLSGATLTGASGTGADLTGADLTGAVATDADLEQATATGLTARGARLENAQLQDADLTGAQLEESTITGADLTGARLGGTTWAGSSGTGAVFASADLSQARLDDADLAGASFVGAQLGGMRANDANLTSADLTSADLRGAILRRADLSGATLDDARMGSAVLASANVRNASFDGADIGAADLTGSTGLSHAQLREALGVPEARLAAAVVRNDVRLEPLEAVVRDVSRVSRGDGVPGAGLYRPSAGFHPLVVLSGQGSSGLLRSVDRASGTWTPPALSFAELVATESASTQTVQVCRYSLTGHPSTTLTRIRHVLTVKVYAARTGELVAERTVLGGEPRACGQTEMFTSSEAASGKKVYGDLPDYAPVVRWLRGLVHPV